MEKYMREDSVFGKVAYDEWGWSRELELDFCGVLSKITLVIVRTYCVYRNTCSI